MDIKEIIRSRRKTIALQVCDDATLIVRAPLRMSTDVIRKVILKHHRWLEKKKGEILARNSSNTLKEYIDGEAFLYLGVSYRLKRVKAHELELDCKLAFLGGHFYLRDSVLHPREAFLSWYKHEAFKIISERVHWYARQRGLKYKQIKISHAQKRWGSCSPSGNLNFSWRLIMAPLPVIDYVVVHELVHLLEKNHSRSFWDKVRLLMPDYKIHRSWLKKNGYLLRL